MTEAMQTLWTKLTTENENIINIGFIPLVYLEVFLSLLLSTSLLNINISKRNKLLYIIIIPTLSIISNILFPQTVRVIINIISVPLFGIFIFKIGILKSIFLEIIPVFVILTSETIWTNFFNIVFNIDSSKFAVIPLYRFIMSSLDYILLYISYILARKYNFNINLLDNVNCRSRKMLITNAVFGVIAIITQLYLVNFYSSTLPSLITLVGLLTIISYFVISFYNLSNTLKLEQTTTDLEKEKEDNKTLKILHEELRGFKHDLGNIMTSIAGYAQTNDIDGLKKYYSQIKVDLNRVNNLSTLNPEVINNPAIYSLLASKYHEADEENIKINLYVFLDLNSLNIQVYTFTRILGILMDNAIQACKECEEKIINLEIRKDMSSSKQLLIIENTYNNKNIDLEKIYEKNYSTKPGNSGLGLWEIKQIMKKDKCIKLITTKDDKFFKQKLEIS